jgi:cell division septation protein DedD
MGVTYAINLDGGGSTKILQKGKSITSAVYNRAVDNVLAVYLKKLYRVQCGAFSKQINAMSLRTKIRDLPDDIGAGYKNAYVRKIDNYYKVQVGAFSNRLNAQMVLNDLKDKGLDAFITTE